MQTGKIIFILLGRVEWNDRYKLGGLQVRAVELLDGHLVGFQFNCFQPLLQTARVLLLFGRVPRGSGLQVGDLLECAAGRRYCQTAWNEKVARVAISHVLDLAGLCHVGDVFFEQNLH